MPENYASRFARLNANINPNFWTASTTYRAPHKPLVLLSVLDLLAEGTIQSNLIEFDDDLVDLFNIYWSIVDPPSQRANIAFPLWHLQSEGFWHLLPTPGYEQRVEEGRAINSLGLLQKGVFGARLDEELFEQMRNESQRELLRAVLIETYFEPALGAKLAAQGVINQQAFRYGQELLQQVKAEKTIKEKGDSAYEVPARDQGFRRVVTRIYDHRCALCGIRMRTPEGHTVVDAAHIVPWSVSRNDDPRNGLALCRLCHWTFDEGLLGVNVQYTVQASPRLRAEQNLPAHLAALDGRGMITPADTDYWPAADSLQWHLGNVFRGR